MKKIFDKLYNFHSLNQKESYYIFNLILKNKLTLAQITAILISMKLKVESIDEIIGAIQACQENILFFPRPKYLFADITGTGGDYMNTINISTLSALLASSFGLKIVKHCNTGVSSSIGSADILKKLNIAINLHPKDARNMLEKNNICFLFAPHYHSAFKYVSEIRKQLNTRTIFNILGPLINPAEPSLSVIGVYSKDLLLPVAHILNLLNVQRAMIIHSDGTDEVTLHSVTHVLEINQERIHSYKLHPEDFGVRKVPKKFFMYNTIQKKYQIFEDICKGNSSVEYYNLIAVNTALILKLFGYEDLKENTKIVFEKIRRGELIKHIQNISNKS
ncbi:anthranilate phosphoribosyltransferase [Buchnera aphidicola]|uniref:anthranilate phosphoribosyltransferase n=1 Tax=Buchnera aphidicola TaxID=9 RepID=UPI0034642F8C